MRGNLTERLHKRCRVHVRIHENPVAESLACDRFERVATRIKVTKISFVAQVNKSTIECVGPTVIRTRKTLDLARFIFHQRRPAMTTGVIERANNTIFAVDDNDRCTQPLVQQEVSRLGYLVDVATVQPGLFPHVLIFEREETGVCVTTTRNSRQCWKAIRHGRPRKLELHAGLDGLHGGWIDHLHSPREVSANPGYSRDSSDSDSSIGSSVPPKKQA